MANEEHLAILKQGVETWNKWREENPDTRPDLSEADLYRTNLSGANLSGADLGGAFLNGADLSGANLSGADLTGADLGGAFLNGADLSGANLVVADLYGADLSGADLSRARLCAADLSAADLSRAGLSDAELDHANLTGAYLSGTNVERAAVQGSVFGDVDLSVVNGLDRVVHYGTSTVGIDTIYKSKGKIPEVFLRGCGVPDKMIAFIVSLVGQPETNLSWLRMMIDEHFNESELRTLCFDMGVDYDSLNGDNKSDKARELVSHFHRRGTIYNLVAKCKELRSSLSWEGEYG